MMALTILARLNKKYDLSQALSQTPTHLKELQQTMLEKRLTNFKAGETRVQTIRTIETR